MVCNVAQIIGNIDFQGVILVVNQIDNGRFNLLDQLAFFIIN